MAASTNSSARAELRAKIQCRIRAQFSRPMQLAVYKRYGVDITTALPWHRAQFIWCHSALMKGEPIHGLYSQHASLLLWFMEVVTLGLSKRWPAVEVDARPSSMVAETCKGGHGKDITASHYGTIYYDVQSI